MSKTRRPRIVSLLTIALGVIVFLIAIFISYTSFLTARILPLPATPTPRPTSTVSAAQLSQYEATNSQNTTLSNVIGQVHVEYPLHIFTQASESIFVQISIPSQLAKVKRESMTRVPVSLAEIDPTNALGEFNTNILVSEIMQVYLSSPSLQTEALYPKSQHVNLTNIDSPTEWAWTIRAPGESGTQVFVIRVFLEDDLVPIWLGSFNLDVEQPVPTPTFIPTNTPTPTPLPFTARVVNKLIDTVSLEVCLGIPASIAVFVALVDQIRKMVKRKRRKTATSR